MRALNLERTGSPRYASEDIASPRIESEPSVPSIHELLADEDRRHELQERLLYGVPEFRRVNVTGEKRWSPEIEFACQLCLQALELRRKYVIEFPAHRPPGGIQYQEVEHRLPKFVPPSLELEKKTEQSVSNQSYKWENGVAVVWEGDDESTKSKYACVPVEEYWADMEVLNAIISSGPCKTFAYNRLKILEARYRLHLLMNEHLELAEQKLVPHRDFYNVRKVDNHVHHSACMNQKHLLRFIKSKLRRFPDEVVYIDKETKQEVTLQEVFSQLKMTPYDLSVDALDVNAGKVTFHRFDRFNLKYNPIGETKLREIFLKYNNWCKGRYLAELTREVFDDLEANKYQLAEYRLSIYGKDPSEWSTLASWVVDNHLFSSNVRWMIQIPRLYQVYKRIGLINNFQEMISNIFDALFKVSIDPSSDPKLHVFLQHVVGFDSVDDESVREPMHHGPSLPYPQNWDRPQNPPYSMWSYYLSANMVVLNRLRSSRGLSTFKYRPHAGEAGDIEHLASTFLVADSINHGILLNESPALQYLYYLSQIGLSVSPLSNNLLFVEYDKNPFFRFFTRGLNVTLSTDDPLMIHVTKEPLVEEYSVAAQVWKLSPVDLCEIARNSVLQSGFEHHFKQYWIGQSFDKKGFGANDITKTNLSNIRYVFRSELHSEEMQYVESHSAGTSAGSRASP
jgi:AMP deaminase